MIRVSIIGANGYTGLELMSILQNHPDAKISHVVSRSNAGTLVRDMYPTLHAFGNLAFEDLDVETVAKDSDVVFTALPHAASAEIGGKFYDLGCRVVDLSADYRYRDIDLYEKWYKVTHPRRDLAALSVYGLPELNREQIKGARLVGNPGCYTTCSILSLFPLLKRGLVGTDNLIIDAKSGTSGAGRKADVHFGFVEVNENFKAYGVTTHRHTSEIEEVLSGQAGKPVLLSFTPHLLPVERGILATCYANLAEGVTAEDIYSAYREQYAGEPFVKFYPEGTLPELKWAKHSNFFHVGFKVDKRLNRVVVVGVLDNLVKGASGQAVENMNLMFGLDESEGLAFPAKYL